MGKTTNILDLNNRLEKVEKGNVAQNNYNSLKNRPKINGNLLTGDKTGTQLGLAEAQDIGDLNALTTTDKSSVVGAINELTNLINEISFTFPSDSTTATVQYPTGKSRDNTGIIAIYFYRNSARYFNQHCFSIALTSNEISISLNTGYEYVQGCDCKLYYT